MSRIRVIIEYDGIEVSHVERDVVIFEHEESVVESQGLDELG